jgi:hypothetical protein
MRIVFMFLVLLLSAGVWVPEIMAQGKLDDFREPYEKDDASPDRSDPPQRHRDPDDDGWDLFWHVFFDGVFGDHGARYCPHPYFDVEHGFLGWSDHERFAEAQTVSFDALSHVHLVDADLVGWGWEMDFRMPSLLSVGYDHTFYYEDVDGGTDSLSIFNIDLSVNVPIDADFLIDLGIGAGGFGGDGLPVGFSWRTGFKWFPGEPFVVRGSMVRMSLSGEPLTDLRFQVGVIHDRFEFSVGYRGMINADDSMLGGPTFGAGIWF